MQMPRSYKPPAITTGLVLFYVLLQVLGASEKLRLTPDALFHLDLNRLSFYPLVFFNWAHLVVGVALFTPLCAQFEVRNGTVRTGVVLNVTAFFVGIAVNLLAKLSGRLLPADFCGTSTWILSFAAILSVNSWALPVIPVRSVVVSIPGYVIPVLMYVVCCVFRPQYFVLHGLALLMGYGLGLGHLGFLVEGTTNVIEWIEAKVELGINGLRYIVHFVGEAEARELRKMTARARSGSINGDDISLPVSNSLTNPNS